MPAAAPPAIRQLSDAIANQIAAGEVVERPANVVKELVENALDAAATRVVVRIEDGGRRLIEVVDDGHGMRADELPLALARHATSKLQSADDLFRVGTLGFRGEALPSIAGVSEFELCSRPTGAEGGARLRVDGSQHRPVEACAMAPGTRVCARNLFWNVPVRLKFLKTAGTETGHVTDMVTRLALAHPGVAFHLECDGRQVLDLPPVAELAPRIRACFGRGLAEGLMPVVGHLEGHQLTGLVARPAHARPSTKRQFVFLNGRAIRDKLIVAAVREGYRGYLEPRLHPVVFLQIDCDPALVDVNVHPTKAEVRFRRDREVFNLVRRALHEALGAEAEATRLLDAPEIKRRTIKAPQGAPPPNPGIQERYLPQQPAVVREVESASPAPAAAARVREAVADYRSEASAAPPPNVPAADDDALAGVHRIVQLHDMYLLIETTAGIRIIDQHALHEKALYLALDPATAEVFGGGTQELLVPITVELSAAEVAALEPQFARLAECGIEAEAFGPTTVAIRRHPAALRKVAWGTLLAGLAESGHGPDALERLREGILHRKACRAAVKAGDRLSEAEQRELVRLLYTIEGLDHCPHGRPTTLDLAWDELERRFQR